MSTTDQLELDDISDLNIDEVIPAQLEPKFDEHSDKIGYDKSNSEEIAAHNQIEGPHPITVFTLVQILLAEAEISNNFNFRGVCPEQVQERHGSKYDKRTYKSYLNKLVEFGALQETEWGGTPGYHLPADVDLAPAFRNSDGKVTLPEIKIDNQDEATSPIHNLTLPLPRPSVNSWRDYFENRYLTGQLLLTWGVILSLMLGQWFRVSGFNPNSWALWVLGAMLSVGVSAMLVGALEITKRAHDLYPLRTSLRD